MSVPSRKRRRVQSIETNERLPPLDSVIVKQESSNETKRVGVKISPSAALGYRWSKIDEFRIQLERVLQLSPPEFDFESYVKQPGNFRYPLFYDDPEPTESSDDGDQLRRFFSLFRTCGYLLVWCWQRITHYGKDLPHVRRLTFWNLIDNIQMRTQYLRLLSLERFGIQVDSGTKVTTRYIVPDREKEKLVVLDWFRNLRPMDTLRDEKEFLDRENEKRVSGQDLYSQYRRLARLNTDKSATLGYNEAQPESAIDLTGTDNEQEIAIESIAISETTEQRQVRRAGAVKRTLLNWIAQASNTFVARQQPVVQWNGGTGTGVVVKTEPGSFRMSESYEREQMRIDARLFQPFDFNRNPQHVLSTEASAPRAAKPDQSEDVYIDMQYHEALLQLCTMTGLSFRECEHRLLLDSTLRSQVFFVTWAAMLVHQDRQLMNRAVRVNIVNRRISRMVQEMRQYFQGWSSLGGN